MTGPLLHGAFDATSVEPDGYIEVIFNDGHTPVSYFFADIKEWHWNTGDMGEHLVVVFKTGDRHELPSHGIHQVKVKGNSQGYVLAQQYLESVAEVDHLEAKLQWKRGQAARQKEAMLRWHATSSSK
jgi:hypothetical protein